MRFGNFHTPLWVKKLGFLLQVVDKVSAFKGSVSRQVRPMLLYIIQKLSL